MRSKTNQNNPNVQNQARSSSINQLPTLNIVKRQIEKYEDDEANTSPDEEQKYIIDDDEILINRLKKRSQEIKRKNATDDSDGEGSKKALDTSVSEKKVVEEAVEDQKENESDDAKRMFYFYSNDEEPIKFLDTSMPEETKNELLMEKSLFDEKNYFPNIENASQKLSHSDDAKNVENGKEDLTRPLLFSNESNDTLSKEHSLLDKIQSIYEKLNTENEEDLNPETTTTTHVPRAHTRFSSASTTKTATTTTVTPTTRVKPTSVVSNTVHKFLQVNTHLNKGASAKPVGKLDQLIYASDSFDEWPGVVNNDSEKTIYESFYELLDTNRRNDNNKDDTDLSTNANESNNESGV